MKLTSTLLFALALFASAHPAHPGGGKQGGTHGGKHGGGKGGRSPCHTGGHKGPPKCADGASPTCSDINGTAVALPPPHHKGPPPMDGPFAWRQQAAPGASPGSAPPRLNCTCADGSTPTPPKRQGGRALRGKRGSRDKDGMSDHGDDDDDGCEHRRHRHGPSPVAICLGATGGLAALAAAFFFVRRRRRSRAAVQETMAKPLMLLMADVAQKGDLPTATSVASAPVTAGDVALQKKLETVV
jgi:MYXO-CTERM domain-containing protein